MCDSHCYLCGKPGEFEKLFRGCKHESACYGCLRNCYIIQAQDVCKYPLHCFHPECNLVVRSTQIERFVESKEELHRYHSLSAKAKINKVRLGANWQEVLEILGAAIGTVDICRCPRCKMLITKDGGCNHMTCFCGREFMWIEESWEYIQNKHSPQSAEQFGVNRKTKSAPVLRVDDEFAEVCEDDSSLNDSLDFFVEDTDETLDLHETCENAQEECADSVNHLVSEFDSVPSDLHSFPSLETRASTTVLEVQTDDCEDDFHVLEIASYVSYDSWSQFDAASESTLQTDGLQSSSQTPWEEVSEVSSVISFHSTTGMSFLEVASDSSNPPTNGGWKVVSKAPRPMIQLQTISEHRKLTVSDRGSDGDDDEMFDADFMLDGAKSSRGGKQKFLFNHQPKRKYRRRDQRQRSSARMSPWW